MQLRHLKSSQGLPQQRDGSCLSHSEAARKAGYTGEFGGSFTTFFSLDSPTVHFQVFLRHKPCHTLLSSFSTLSALDKNSLEKCKLQERLWLPAGGEAFSPAAEHYSACTACKVPRKGPEESTSQVIITHFFTEHWRWRSSWICLPANPTAAEEIIILHISQHRGPDNKPSPNETTPFPKQFSHISIQRHPR